MAKKRKVDATVTSATMQTVTSLQVGKITKQVENMPTVYYNHARVAAGFFDFRVFFGEQTVSPTGEVTFSESLCVAMTPEFANLFFTLLGQQVAAFQKLYGFRPVPNNETFKKFREMQDEANRNSMKQ